jgi:hypothetical protein
VCLGNALRLETYIQDADREGDSQVADLFQGNAWSSMPRRAMKSAAAAPARAE